MGCSTVRVSVCKVISRNHAVTNRLTPNVLCPPDSAYAV
jgi:hypothetical protein